MSSNKICGFSSDFYKLILEDKNVLSENFIFSPVSIYAALACVLAGTRNESEKELLKLLHVNSVSEAKGIHEQIGDDLKNLIVKSKETDCLLANRLFVDNKFKIKTSYTALVKKHYSSEPQNLDFFSKTEQCRQIINKWVKENTGDKIKELIPINELDAQTVIMIVNTLYFKGLWEKPFDIKNTRDAKFKMLDKTTLDVPMMFINKSINLCKHNELDAMSIMLPFKNSDLNLFVLLPNNDDGLLDLTKKLFDIGESPNGQEGMSNLDITLSSQNYFRQEVDLYLPRFKIDGGKSIRLEKYLKKLGVKQIFDYLEADFSNLSDQKNLFVSNISHQAVIEVDEKGAVAVAATSVEISNSCYIEAQQPIEFRADHPFIVAIGDKKGTPLFLGHFTNPK